MSVATKTFRTSFHLPKELMNWYPGHMSGSFKQMQNKMKTVDCVIELHDARIPYTGRNPMFVKSLVGTKPHILVLNKMDLTNSGKFPTIIEKFKEENISNVVYTNSLDQNCLGMQRIIPLASKLVKSVTRRITSEEMRYKIMVVGIPNVGKSTFINALRHISLKKGKALKTGAIPGVTRSVHQEIRVSSDPFMYLIDTPGILMPNIVNVECGMKLALCSCLRDELVGIIQIADFWLYWMNKTGNFKYVYEYNIKEPIDDIMPLLIKIAVDNNKTKRIKNVATNTLDTIPDVRFAAHDIVKKFRTGHFGDLDLDIEYFQE